MSKSFLFPIKRNELSQFIPLALQLFLSVLVYSLLRSLKDSLVVPNIGAESLSFIKSYMVLPAAFTFVLVYSKMVGSLNYKQIYHLFAASFVAFFACFNFILLPYEAALTPDKTTINNFLANSLTLGNWQLNYIHFKWFALVAGKWTYALFYVMAELWSSVMNVVLFWQLANQVTSSETAKRFYPMFGFFASAGSLCAGMITSLVVKLSTAAGHSSELMLQTMVSIVLICIAIILMLFRYISINIIDKSPDSGCNTLKPLKDSMGFRDSFRILSKSKFLWGIFGLILCYGIATSLFEGVWKSQIRALYPQTEQYLAFMGIVFQWIGGVSMAFILLGTYILNRFGWLISASITPIVYLITGVTFFALLTVAPHLDIFISSIGLVSASYWAVTIGGAHQVLSKSSKYALFDATKEMVYIPLGPELKTKGKAAVDSFGSRFAKSVATNFQTLIFIIFPALTYDSMVWHLMAIYVAIVLIWLIDVRMLYRSIRHKL